MKPVVTVHYLGAETVDLVVWKDGKSKARATLTAREAFAIAIELMHAASTALERGP